MNRRRIVWIQSEPTPYWAHTFRAIANEPEFDLEVFFLNRVTEHHPWESDLTRGYDCTFPEYRFGIEWSFIGDVLGNSGLTIVGRWSTLMSGLLLGLLSLSPRQFGLCTDTPFTNRSRGIWKTVVRKVWLNWLFHRVSMVLTTGEPGREALRGMGCPPARIVNFPFFVDLDFFQPPEGCSGSAGDKIWFISSGRVKNSHKGYDLALRALSRARKKSSLDFHYSIAGEGPDLPDLRSLARELGIQESVSFLGWKEPAELRDIYHQSDAMIHPAPSHDPFPVSVLEAMAAGLPILGSRAAGSVRDRVEHGVSGLIHEPGDVEQLAEQLSELPQRNLAKMGKKARETAEDWPVERGISVLKDRLAALE